MSEASVGGGKNGNPCWGPLTGMTRSVAAFGGGVIAHDAGANEEIGACREGGISRRRRLQWSFITKLLKLTLEALGRQDRGEGVSCVPGDR